MKGFGGKVALVTGGSSGIGLAAARELGKAGAKVALVGRGRERGEAAARALREEGLEAHYVQADMGKHGMLHHHDDGGRWNHGGAVAEEGARCGYVRC